MRFAPTVMMANREDIRLEKFMTWVQRQLVAAKSCGPNWRIVALHAFSLTGSQLAALLTLILSLAMGNTTAGLVATASIGLYWTSAAISTLVTEFAVRRVLARNADAAIWPRMAWLLFGPALGLTHIVYPLALFGAYSQQRVSWRGIEYLIRGVNDIEMCNYHPYPHSVDMRESVI